MQCDTKTEVYSRIAGYYRPIQNWHKGKREEFRLRKMYTVDSEQKDFYNAQKTEAQE